jgi:prophage antirepressor-like protein
MIPDKTRERQVISLAFQDRAVRTVLIDGVPWFIAKDVCDILGLGNPAETLRNFPVDEKGINITDTLGGKQEMLTVNEPGLYRLIFQSRKPEAEQFKTWVFNTVLPQIRQEGFFFADPAKLDSQELSLFLARHFAPRQTGSRKEIFIGKCLYHLKNSKPHGGFMPCLASIGVPHKTAERYLKR